MAETVQITSLSGRIWMQLKSWLPEHTSGGKPVIFAGEELPSHVGTSRSGVLYMGPGEWLVVSHDHQASILRDLTAPELRKQGLVLVDVTDGFAGLEVRGAVARNLLSKGCGLDLHPRSFPAGHCGRTRFAQIPVVIECLDEPPRFELHVARSHFHYLQDWLTDAATEFQAVSTGS